MTFQFLCPQGHLLQGEEAHMGMQCQCPQCGTAFIIPTIQGSAQPQPQLEPAPQAPHQALEQLAAAEKQQPASARQHDDFASGQFESQIEDEPLLHIPCPNGHELDTPLDMIGQRAMCPHCGAEFRLKREKSREYLQQQEILERRRAKFWFQLAIVAASFVGVVLVAMMIVMAVT
jgi:hypothetical protein